MSDTGELAEVARQALSGYFLDLEEGRFEAATQWFTEDAAYSHPPYPEDGPDAPRHEVRGRADILRLFQRRGIRSHRHTIEMVTSVDDQVLASGVVVDVDGAVIMSFVSQATLDRSTGLLSRYAAYASAPAVWHVLEGSR